ncbi:hypothetical protein SAMN02745181_3896 [Rubritalea squalenifaciens DSM 18772]|uniref:Uncharacterized protein n=1 Tax=Rubritalea squalenifaciens DSM 18772 TaxID=1123071 RepID=A0A1M6SU96_9BACT|nr:hypothetical protein SAMN02745181_3896 [Rubritalea squalenifaciens DSM 18772]
MPNHNVNTLICFFRKTHITHFKTKYYNPTKSINNTRKSMKHLFITHPNESLHEKSRHISKCGGLVLSG